MRIAKIKYESRQVLPQTVADAVLSNDMTKTLPEMLDERLSATEDDEAKGHLTLSGGATTDELISSNHQDGVAGYRFNIVDGISFGEIDDLTVRRKATFSELAIKEMRHIAGALVVSPASAKIDKVEESDTSYHCYFRGNDGDTTVENSFYTNDLVMCHRYNQNYISRYYWRRCTSFSTEPDADGYHRVTLSKSDCAAFSDAPQAGDTIVSFGNSKYSDRQNVIVLNSEGGDVPYFMQLTGIKTYGYTDENILTKLSSYDNIIRGDAIELLVDGAYKSVITIADEQISAKVGECGIDIDAKTINLSASNTIVSGDLSVQRVNTYYPDGSLRSSFNGSDNGTIIYYYPNGQVMREDCFVYDDSGNVAGMTTTYYDANGLPTWRIDQGGFVDVLSSYWQDLGEKYYCGTVAEMQEKLAEFAAAATNWTLYFDKANFSKFISVQDEWSAYNGRIAMGKYNSATPAGVEWYSGLIVEGVEIISATALATTYRATYTQTSGDGLSQISFYDFTNV